MKESILWNNKQRENQGDTPWSQVSNLIDSRSPWVWLILRAMMNYDDTTPKIINQNMHSNLWERRGPTHRHCQATRFWLNTYPEKRRQLQVGANRLENRIGAKIQCSQRLFRRKGIAACWQWAHSKWARIYFTRLLKTHHDHTQVI